MNTILNDLLEKNNVRANLSALRKELKDSGGHEKLERFLAEHEPLFFGFLECEDPKTRKNAALLLGDLRYEPAASALYAAYQKEETLFVRSAYLQALSGLDVEPMLEGLKEQLARLKETEPAPENRKHTAEEVRALRRLLIPWEGIPVHTFDMGRKKHTVLLLTGRDTREAVLETVKGGRLHPLGVWVQTDDLQQLLLVRTCREMVFPMGERAKVSADPAEAAAELSSWMADLCRRCHREDGSFYFRVECRGRWTLEERSRFSRRLGEALEERTKGLLVNAPGDYEVELRLIERSDGCFFPCLKFFTLPDRRFAYRKNALPVSIHPSLAALTAELARPWLKEDAQILDPFCGVGTMLIERDIAVPAGQMYGTDTYGEAIALGRQNAKSAGADIHFINRDYFDFTHSVLFDEIITDMPRRQKCTKEETDALYRRFFEKSAEILAPSAVIVMYTEEVGFVKKQLRLRREYRLLQEFCMQSKGGFYLLVIELKK